MGEPKVPDLANIQFAAQVGDPAAMRILGRYLFRPRSRDLAREWLLAAAEAGDPEAMYDLGRGRLEPAGWQDPARLAELASWLRRAAEAGCVAAIEKMSEDSKSSEEREFWLRRAAEGGARRPMNKLAILLEERGQATEAEHWYRAAIANGLTYARLNLARFLIEHDRELYRVS
jgi:TPR repeat protein